MDITKAKDMVRKLLATANDGAATDGEVDNALKFARKIMLQHNFGEDDVAPKEQFELDAALRNTQYGQVTCYSFSQGLTDWEASMVWAICDLVGTVNWYLSGKHVTKRSRDGKVQYNMGGPNDGNPKLATSYVIYGPQEDVLEAAELIYEWQEIVVAMARLRFGGFVRKEGRSYCEGFCSELRNKVRRIEQEETKSIAHTGSSGGTGLILLQSKDLMRLRKEGAQDWLKREQGIHLGKGKASRRSGEHHHGAYSSGQSDGKNAEFSRNFKAKISS